jgi:hypothetical protein
MKNLIEIAFATPMAKGVCSSSLYNIFVVVVKLYGPKDHSLCAPIALNKSLSVGYTC